MSRQQLIYNALLNLRLEYYSDDKEQIRFVKDVLEELLKLVNESMGESNGN